MQNKILTLESPVVTRIELRISENNLKYRRQFVCDIGINYALLKISFFHRNLLHFLI